DKGKAAEKQGRILLTPSCLSCLTVQERNQASISQKGEYPVKHSGAGRELQARAQTAAPCRHSENSGQSLLPSPFQTPEP
ncbi:unnamed protein product, partial [Coccothraustes coccothraustes]